MTWEGPIVTTDVGPYHEGERHLQERAGVRTEADRLSGMISTRLTTAAQLHLMTTRTAMLAVTDADRACWITGLLGDPGFLEPTREGLRIHQVPGAGDPTGPRQPGDHLGLLVINLEARRRLRVNGRVRKWGPNVIEMSIQEAYGNCPRHIRQRSVDHAPRPGTVTGTWRSALTSAQQEWIRHADTLFIGTDHPEFGADASHRAGPPGFVDVPDIRHLVIPDYAGNNMFNTLGNIAVHPSVGLLFWDVLRGRTLQITGNAAIDDDPPAATGVARQLHVRISSIVESAPASA
jgi:predicted pyridoxine 5'-phosphate oxidase superfamily flavin-nucleotide-binding protein